MRPMPEGLEGRALLSVGLDPTYGFGGVALPNVPQNTATTENFESISSVANQSGKVVAAGTLTVDTLGSSGTTTRTMVVVRFNTDGSIDTSFGTNGTQMIPIASGGVTFDGSANDIAVQSDGKIDVVGTATSSTAQDIVVARLNSNGTIDTTFGTSGFRLVPFTSSTSTPLSATGNALNIGPDGKIVAAGYVDTGGTGGDDFAIARLNTDGSLDTSFNTTGTATVAFDLGGATGPNDDIANDVVVQPDSKIVVVGSADVPASGGITGLTHAAVARLNANGTLDTSFNTTGKLDYTYNLGGTSADTANAVALQGTQIVIAGTSTQQFGPSSSTGLTYQAITVTRLNSNGSFDTSFNGSGKFLLTLNRGGIDFSSSSSALLVLPDNSLLVGGSASEKNSFTGGTGILVKLTTGGTLDPSYGTAGAALLPASMGGRMIMQPDGKVAYGTFNGVARTTAPTPGVVTTTIVSTGTGKRAKASAIKITFNTGLNQALATNSKIYTILPAKGRKAIAIRKNGGVAYDPTTQTLTLSFARKVPGGSGFRVLIAPGGILGADGQVLAISTILVPVTTA
jgi:uncharacterized delta-60 repeat protein